MKRFGMVLPGEAGEAAWQYPLQLAVHAAGNGWRPFLVNGLPAMGDLAPLHRHALMLATEDDAGDPAGEAPGFPVLHWLGERLALPAGRAAGRPDIGVARLHQTDIPAQHLRAVAQWPLILAASSWNRQLLRDKGLTNVLRCPPGIDLSLFHPASRAGLFPGRFLVFAGGPLTHRTGPDILAAAFSRFRQRHPEALLVAAWEAPDAEPCLPDATGLPVAAWLARNGLGPEAALDLGTVPQAALPAILRECDVAAFPSRCEGDPNPLAMAALACGVPTILSGNTGHLDLVGDHLYCLKDQREIAGESGARDGWGESSVEELLETLQRVHDRRHEARAKAQAAARYMLGWSWERQSATLLAAIEKAVAGASPTYGSREAYAWGICLHQAQQAAKAEQVYSAILERVPAHVGARMDRANIHRMTGDYRAAEADFRRVLGNRPDHAPALRSLGNMLRSTGRLEESARALRRSVDIDPRAAAHWDLAFTLLLQGRYAEAWPHFEHRHAALGLRTPEASLPRWDGGPLAGRTLLVLDEQGLGDTVQFLRFLPHIPSAARIGDGGRVIFAGKAETLSMAQRLLPPEDVFDWDRPFARTQCWAGLMSLPRLLGIRRPEDIPGEPLHALRDPARIAAWRPKVRATDDRPVVGLCWRGNPYFVGDAKRSPGLAALRAILEVEGVRFVSLQVGRARREISDLGLERKLADIGGAVEAAGSDCLDTLAVLESCDLVISSCTSLAHMAGVIGRPAWVLLSDQPDWRWMMDREDSPWYPSLRLIRQRAPGDWAGVAATVADRLARWHDSR